MVVGNLGRLPAVIPPKSLAPFGLALAVAGPLAAQSGSAVAQPAPRDRMAAAEAFADTVSAITDRDVLRGLERDLMLRARRERSNPVVHFRLGALALAQDQPSDAAAEFKWAAQLEGQWAAAWFGLGQAELRLGELADTTQLGRRALLARDAWARATGAFTRSVQLDTTNAGRLERAVRERSSAPSSVVYRDALRRVVTGPNRLTSASVAVALGRAERSLGDTARAVAAFDQGVAWSDRVGVALVEAARTRLTGRIANGVENYFRAAVTEDPEAVGLLREDFRWIATAAELTQFEAAEPTDRAQLLWRFWAGRDRAELRQNGERLTEHYRRLAVASRAHPNRDDLRFAVLVRHGEPDGRATARMANLRANETWRYRRPDGDLVVHFVAGADTTNYRLTESLFDLVPGEGSPAGDERGGPVDLTEALIRSRAQLSPFYQAAAAGSRAQLGLFRIRERELGRASLNLAQSTDRFPIRFDRDLPARIGVLGVPDGERSEIVVSFAVPSYGLDSAPASGDYLLRLRVSAWNLVSEVAYAIDTVVAAKLGGPGGVVYGSATLPVPPGGYALRGVLDAGGGRGAFAARDSVAVGAKEPGWGVSDIAVGVAGRGVLLGPDRPFEPSGSFGQADTVVVSATLEAAGVDPLRAQVSYRPTGGRGESKWRRFSGVADQVGLTAGAPVVARLPLRRLRPGFYEVELLVEWPAGRSNRRSVRIEVAGPEK